MKKKLNADEYIPDDGDWLVWKCNYVKGCNKGSYYSTTINNKHVYICPEHLNEYLGYD